MLGFLCCGALVGSYFLLQDNQVKPNSKEIALERDRVIEHIKNNFSKNVKTKTPVYLYVKAEGYYKPVGQIASEMKITLKDINLESVQDEFLQVENSDIYVRANNLVTDEMVFKDRRLIPFNQNIVTKEDYKLESEDGKAIGMFNDSSTYMVLSKTEDGYLVRFQNNYGIINKEDVKEVVEHQNTTEKIASEIPVFMYHFFFDASKGETGEDIYWVEKQKFDQQMKYLKENNYHVLTMEKLEDYIDGKVNYPQKSVVLTIDDGNNTVYRYAQPILNKYKLNSTMFVVTGWQESATLSESMLEMKNSGMNIQSHSHKLHESDCGENNAEARLICWDKEKVINDLKTSLDYVEGGKYLAYPFGAFTDESKQRVKEAGIEMAFSTREDKVHVGQDKYAVPRICVVKDLSMEHFIQYLTHQ